MWHGIMNVQVTRVNFHYEKIAPIANFLPFESVSPFETEDFIQPAMVAAVTVGQSGVINHAVKEQFMLVQVIHRSLDY